MLNTKEMIIIIHFGMSGSIKVLSYSEPLKKHDHVDILLDNGKCLRFNDPRRFGFLLINDDFGNKLINNLGVEPLSEEFSADYLFRGSRKRKIAIKTFLMDNRIVVGIGNIYANEALFLAKINPKKPAGKVSLKSYKLLVSSLKKLLLTAIGQGGTTFRNFISGEGKKGAFQQFLEVYGRTGKECSKCNTLIVYEKIAGRGTFFCRHCQK